MSQDSLLGVVIHEKLTCELNIESIVKKGLQENDNLAKPFQV